jgi:hypothetical protein
MAIYVYSLGVVVLYVAIILLLKLRIHRRLFWSRYCKHEFVEAVYGDAIKYNHNYRLRCIICGVPVNGSPKDANV